MHRREGVAIVGESKGEERHRDRDEQLQRRIQRGDLEDDQQEADAVLHGADMTAVADALRDGDRHVGDRIGASKERHRAGGGVTEPIREQVQEFAKPVSADGAKA